MAHLPNDIIATIMEASDLSIDAYLAFKDEFALRPGKVSVDAVLKSKLDTHLKKRSMLYKQRRTIDYPYCSPISHFTYFNRTETNIVDIVVDDYSSDGRIRMCFTVLQTNHDIEQTWTIRKSSYDVHTGETCDHWIDDEY
jgi:hypothetical protein